MTDNLKSMEDSKMEMEAEASKMAKGIPADPWRKLTKTQIEKIILNLTEFTHEGSVIWKNKNHPVLKLGTAEVMIGTSKHCNTEKDQPVMMVNFVFSIYKSTETERSINNEEWGRFTERRMCGNPPPTAGIIEILHELARESAAKYDKVEIEEFIKQFEVSNDRQIK